jgi:hypothetical protein
MVADGGTRLVNEASLWSSGQFVTTNLVVTQSFLKANPSAVNGLLKGQIQANDYISKNQTAAEQDQADMSGAMSIMIMILVLGILVDSLFNIANGRIRRRWGLTDPASGG